MCVLDSVCVCVCVCVCVTVCVSDNTSSPGAAEVMRRCCTRHSHICTCTYKHVCMRVIERTFMNECGLNNSRVSSSSQQNNNCSLQRFSAVPDQLGIAILLSVIPGNP